MPEAQEPMMHHETDNETFFFFNFSSTFIYLFFSLNTEIISYYWPQMVSVIFMFSLT